MAGGRPTKYLKSMCQVVIDQMTEGASKIEVCAGLGVCYDTFLAWQKEHEEFSESVKRGDQLSEAWWMRQGRQALREREFNYTGWYMNMKNRHGWADKQEHNLRSDDGSMSPKAGIDTSKLSTEALAEIMALHDDQNS